MAPSMQMGPQPRPTTTSEREAPQTSNSQEQERERARNWEEERQTAARREEAERLDAERQEAKKLEIERLEAKRKQQVEQERLAKEHQQRVEAHYSYVKDQWDLFQKVQHDAPPTLLALEKKYELETFQKFLASQTPRILERGAIDRFESEIVSQAREADAAFLSIKQSLESTSLFNNLRKLLGIGKVLELLRKCVVSISVPELGSPGREAVASARKFLRQAWSSHLDQKTQGLFSVHRCAGKTIMHLGSGSFGSIFITLPQSLEPQALAEAFLSEIRKVSSDFMPRDGTLAVIDGDLQGINYQQVFPNNIVVRSIKDDCETFAVKLNKMLEREPPNPENTALHLGVPTSREGLNAVFKRGGADWDLWREVAPLWSGRAVSRGFDMTTSASSEQIVESLATSKNVIIVVAHADGNRVYLPAPPPEGSELSDAQIIERKAEISANAPIVYLFCCETAEVSNLRSFSQVLLECGASAVIAPQTKIDAERSVDFFEGIIANAKTESANSLTNLRAAERRSNYREMEIWLG